MLADKTAACPFCNFQPDETAALEIDAGMWVIACPNCGGIGPPSPTQPGAIQRWSASRIHVDEGGSGQEGASTLPT